MNRTNYVRRPKVAVQLRRTVIPRSLPAISSAYVSGTEVKSLDVPIGVIQYNPTGNVIPLNLIRAGSTFCNRVGRRISMKSIQMFGRIAPVAVSTGTTQPDTLRTAIVYDRQTNGALPALSDIFQDTDQAAANTTNSLSGVNLNNRERFQIFMDKKTQTPQITSTAGAITSSPYPTDGGSQDDPFRIDFYRKLFGLEAHYKADSSPAVIGDISTGGLYVVVFGDSTSGWQLTLKTRLRYLDN